MGGGEGEGRARKEAEDGRSGDSHQSMMSRSSWTLGRDVL